MAPPRNRNSGTGENDRLPDPDVDITKTNFLMVPIATGGPHTDAIHNQASIMVLI